MIFHAAEKDLDFELAGKKYVVPVNSEVDIPDSVAYCIKARGIPLVAGPCGGAIVKPEKAVPLPRIKKYRVSYKDTKRALEGLVGDDEEADGDEG